MPSYEPVEALMRGLRVLEAVNRIGPCRLADLEAGQLLSRGTLVRMLETLIHAGYVRRSEGAGLYAATPACRKLSAGFDPSREIARRADPVLARLQQRAGWPCDVAVLDGVEMVTVANSPTEGRLVFNRPAGWSAPILASSIGLAYIAFAPQEEQAFLLSRLIDQPEPWNDPARDFTQAQALFATIRAQGHATIDPRWAGANGQSFLRTIGVPVLVQGRPVAAMNFVFTAQVIELDEAVGKLLGPLQDGAAELGEALADLF